MDKSLNSRDAKTTDRQKEALDTAIATWQPYSKGILTLVDAEEIRTNSVEFITLLEEWSRKDIGNESPGHGHKISEENA